MVMRCLLACGVVLAALFSGGCATILNSDTQQVAFDSDPPGATIKIDGAAYGKTPSTIPVPRRGFDKTVEISLDGYKTEVFTLKNNAINGATLLNVLWFPGAIVDGISGRGGSYQNTVRVVLEKGSGVQDRRAEQENLEKKAAQPASTTSP